MRFIVALSVVWLILLTLILGVGVAIGFFLEWLLGIDRGPATLSGLVATSIATFLLFKLMHIIDLAHEEMAESRVNDAVETSAPPARVVQRVGNSKRRSPHRSEDL